MTDLHDILTAGRMLGGSGGSPAPEPVLIAKTITANGTYSAADEGADGYSEVTAAVPQRAAATGQITTNNNPPKISVTLDQSQPFEIVVCFYAQSDWLTEVKFLTAPYGETDSFYTAIDTDGRLFFHFFWGSHSWSDSDRRYIVDDGSHVVKDGTTPNYLRARREQSRLTLEHSTDGVNYTFLGEAALPDNMTNLVTAAPVYLGGVGRTTSNRYLEHINIVNCYFKQNGSVVWGRDIG